MTTAFICTKHIVRRAFFFFFFFFPGLTRYVDLPECRRCIKEGRRPTANGEFIANAAAVLADLGEIGSTLCRLVSTSGGNFDGKTRRPHWKSSLYLGRAAAESTNGYKAGRYRARRFHSAIQETRRMSMTATAMPGLSTLRSLGRISKMCQRSEKRSGRRRLAGAHRFRTKSR